MTSATYPAAVDGLRPCNLCGQTFFSFWTLSRHTGPCRRNGVESTPVDCPMEHCATVIKTGHLATLAKHVLLCHGYELYLQNKQLNDPEKPVCEDCHAGFDSQARLKKHLKEFDHSRPWTECSIDGCRFRTDTDKSAKIHEHSHSAEAQASNGQYQRARAMRIVDQQSLDIPPLQQALLVERHSAPAKHGWSRDCDKQRRTKDFEVIKALFFPSRYIPYVSKWCNL